MFRCICTLLSLICILPRIDGHCAQELDTWFPATYEPGTTINLFTQWNGMSLDEGFLVSLPSDWNLTAATAIRQAYRYIPLDAENLSDGRILLSSSESMRGTYDLVLQVLTDRSTISLPHRVSVASAVKVGTDYIQDEGNVRRGELRPKFGTESGFVLVLEKNLPPLHIEPQWLEALHDSHTLEFWLRTSTLNAVVLSTWNGSEMSLYPMELVVDARGRMRYYRNTVGHHVTLSTEIPVADGTWHHVALVHDAETYWTKLFLDGETADSLYDPASTHIGGVHPVAFGGRVNSGKNSFAGELDDLVLWPSPRSATHVRSMMRETQSAEGALVLDFESSKSFRYFDDRNAIAYRVAGGPTPDPPIHGFRGIVFDQGVMLTWQNEDPHSEAFLVERSEDGNTFESLARINRSFEGVHWSYTDLNAPDRVVFYRLVQDVPGRASEVVGTIKLGLGAETIPAPIEILGNYPNPFNPRTSIMYKVRESQHLQLSIINLAGHVITVLVNRHHEVGEFEAVWDGNELPSGTYFARLQGMDGIVHTRQILLTK